MDEMIKGDVRTPRIAKMRLIDAIQRA